MPLDAPGVTSIGYPDVYYAMPTVNALRHRGDLCFSGLAPQELLGAVTSNRFSTYLLSPWHLIQSKNLLVIPGIGVAANGMSGSERLVSAAPLASIEAVSVHPNARHLVPLLRLIYLERGLPLPTISDVYDAHETSVLYGGDEGRDQQSVPGHDLGTLWQETTDLPLVLGAWACAPGSPYRSLRHTLGGVARSLGAPESEIADEPPFLHHDLLSRESDSLRHFNTLAIRHRLVESNEEAISFC